MWLLLPPFSILANNMTNGSDKLLVIKYEVLLNLYYYKLST